MELFNSGAFRRVIVVAAAATLLAPPLAAQRGGRGNQEPGPEVTVAGHTYTQASLFQRNVGGPDDQTAQFPPHKIIGNIYYVGTAMYNLQEKYAKLSQGGPNPFIDPAGYKTEVDIDEAMFHAVLEAQQKGASR